MNKNITLDSYIKKTFKTKKQKAELKKAKEEADREYEEVVNKHK